MLSHSASGTESVTWKSELLPSEVLGRNFYFCSIDDPSVVELRSRIGVDHIMVESDYPHADSTWPDTQAVLASTFGHLPDDELRAIAAGNAVAGFPPPAPRSRRLESCPREPRRAARTNPTPSSTPTGM